MYTCICTSCHRIVEVGIDTSFFGGSYTPEEGGDFDDREERILQCKDVLGSYCPKVFGELFKIYSDWAGELCGSHSDMLLKCVDLVD